MKILVTGGAGYLGTALIPRLLENPTVEKVTVYDNLARGNHSFFLGTRMQGGERLFFVEGDILDSRTLQKALKGIDIVYHLAAKVTTPFANVDAHFYEQVNHWGTAELMDAIEQSQVSALVYLSSAGVYGASSEELTESSPLNPKTFYGISKMRGEEQVRRLAGNRKTYIVRCGNVFGFNRSMRFDAVINRFAFDAHFKKKIQVHGDGHQTRAFVHIDRASEILSSLPFSTLQPATYNLVQHNLKVIDVVDVLKTLVPELEFQFINQHLSLRSIRVRPSSPLDSLASAKAKSFGKEMEEFMDKLSF